MTMTTPSSVFQDILSTMNAHQMRSLKNTINQLVKLHGKHVIGSWHVFRTYTPEDFFLEMAKRDFYKRHPVATK
jgi:hypothetical protein